MTAYDRDYLVDAMENLGEMADCAPVVSGLALDAFWQLFAASTVAREIAAGSPFAIVGKTGLELAVRVCEQGGISFPRGLENASNPSSFGLTPSYWCGWILALYQWHAGMTFAEIDRLLPMSVVQRMYRTFHEESEERFLEAADEIIASSSEPSGLKRQRLIAGLSQSQLARRSGVGIRAIQQYEQGAKSIERASFGNVQRLAQALHCRSQDLVSHGGSYEYAAMRL